MEYLFVQMISHSEIGLLLTIAFCYYLCIAVYRVPNSILDFSLIKINKIVAKSALSTPHTICFSSSLFYLFIYSFISLQAIQMF